jgi:two-component system NarL family sensor kinase
LKRTIQFMLALLLAPVIQGLGQNLSVLNRDSLLRLLPAAKDDTSKVLLLISTGSVYEHNQPDSALYYYKAAGDLSKKINWPVGILKYISNYTAVLNVQDKYSESLSLNLQAIDLSKKINNNLQLACAYENTAASFYGLKNFTAAVDHFLKAATLLEQINDKPRLVISYGNLAAIMTDLDEYDRSYEYGLKAIRLSRDLDDKYSLEEALINTGNTLSYLKKRDSALVLLQQAKLLAAGLNDRLTTLTADIDIADIYRGEGNYTGMKKEADECLTLSLSIGNKEGAAESYLDIGYYYFYQKEFAKAKENETVASGIALQNNLPELIQKCYLLAGDISLATGDLAEFTKFRSLKDSMQNLTINNRILRNSEELEAKYSLDKKQSEIDSLSKEKQIRELNLAARKNLNMVLAGAVIILLLLAFLYHKNYRQRKKLLMAGAVQQQQRITRLEQEKQLSAAESILQGQDEERKRLAKDLHDGLGGILSATKYSLSNIKNSMIITEESAAAFERGMALLDKSINELRRVSHNMMPEALVKFGLDTALRDYCNSINQSGAVKLSYQSFDLTDDTVPPAKASVIYRIVQELINNTMKHAGAENALVQLILKNEALSIAVEDDGKGFDPAVLHEHTGIGYSNLQNRVTYLKGTLDMQTAEGKGVSINIEIPDINA